MDISIRLVYETLSGTPTPGQIEPGSNSNEGVTFPRNLIA